MIVRPAVVLAILLLSGCYKGPDAGDDILRKYGTSDLPIGVLTPAPGASSPAVTGIYRSGFPSSPDCCWTSGAASFEVAVPKKAHELLTTTFLPDFPLFHRHTQEVAISVDGGTTYRFPDLGVGKHLLRVPLPPHRADWVATVSMKATFTFVPFKEHLTRDGRSLAIYLRSVRAI